MVCHSLLQISASCAAHVRRAMHLRAADIHLLPEIQENCMADLGKLCNSKLEKGQVAGRTSFIGLYHLKVDMRMLNAVKNDFS